MFLKAICCIILISFTLAAPVDPMIVLKQPLPDQFVGEKSSVNMSLADYFTGYNLHYEIDPGTTGNYEIT